MHISNQTSCLEGYLEYVRPECISKYIWMNGKLFFPFGQRINIKVSKMNGCMANNKTGFELYATI